MFVPHTLRRWTPAAPTVSGFGHVCAIVNAAPNGCGETIGSAGPVCIYVHTTAHIVVDVSGTA